MVSYFSIKSDVRNMRPRGSLESKIFGVAMIWLVTVYLSPSINNTQILRLLLLNSQTTDDHFNPVNRAASTLLTGSNR